MQQLSDRTATFTDSVIRRMTRISNAHGAINLSQGFPDFEPPAELLASLQRVASRGDVLGHQYAITWGAQAFRDALAEKQSARMGVDIDPDEHIVVTCGSTEAMWRFVACCSVLWKDALGSAALSAYKQMSRRLECISPERRRCCL